MRKPTFWTLFRDLARWHVTTQYGARHNALLACTALAQRRRERDEIEPFLRAVQPSATVESNRADPMVCGQPVGEELA
jgi:hypothetical protein